MENRRFNFHAFLIRTAVCTLISLLASLLTVAILRSRSSHTEVEYF